MTRDGVGPDPEPDRRPRTLDVPVAPIAARGRRRGPGAVVVVAVAIVVVIAGGVVLAQRFPVGPADQDPAVDAAASAAASGSAATAPPDPTQRPSAPTRLTAAQVASGVRDGTLDGWLVYADATLLAACPGGEPCATGLAVAGLGLEVFMAAGATDGEATEIATQVPDRAVLVLEVRGGRLAYLGPLVVHQGGTPPIDRVSVALPGGDRSALPVLTDAGGWLVIQRGASMMVTGEEPGADGEPGSGPVTAVTLAPGAWGIDDTPGAVTPGPFLVRRADPTAQDAPAWEVVARYHPSRSVRVVIP